MVLFYFLMCFLGGLICGNFIENWVIGIVCCITYVTALNYLFKHFNLF